MKIVAYKCVHDGKIFEDKTEYEKHLRALSRSRAKARKQQKEFDELMNRCIMVVRGSSTFAELERNFALKFDEVHRYLTRRGSFSKYVPAEVAAVKFDVVFKEKCSNSHASPHNGETNWHRNKDLPLHYPGWEGNIKIVLTKHLDIWLTDLFKYFRIFTGTGGSTGIGYSYHVTLFADDFPNLYENYVKEKNWKALGGKSYM